MANLTNKQPEEKETGNTFAKIMGIFTLVVLCVFPVVYHNYYFDILETKYQFYCASAISMIVMMCGWGLYNGKIVEYLNDVSFKKIFKSLNCVDWALLAFWFANVMSCVFCSWRWEAFWGTSGRYNGVFLMTIYVVVYFLTTRFLKLKRVYLDVFLLVSIFVCLFGITDYFQMDLLGFKERMLDRQKALYTSTLGNINTYTVYVGAALCISMILYILESCSKRMVFYFAMMVFSMVALITGASDNAYLTLVALFGLSPLYLFRKKTWLRKYLASVAAFLTVVIFVGWINESYSDIVLGLDSIFVIISSLSILPIITAALWVIVGIWTVVARKNGSQNEELSKALILAWCAVIVAVVAVVVYILYDANIAGNAEKYNAIKNYVVFDDDWGTLRGYVWKRSVILFVDILTPFQKLFGYGADTFKLLMMQYYPPEKSTVFDSAHNEYLHFLVTTGFVGMTAYIATLATAVISMAKRMKDRPEVAAIMFVVLAYATQATVNINLPVIFPLIWQLLAMGLSKKAEE